ncbi:hypothetical protein DNHGIG_00460 [Collibacillus ludicampi]|uniref:Uncharacterized protein n=1 Tax=Collibacillus ludicampi TaxID=2771369 RepID=A0AAV4L9P0_9BACL|nr:hypothetical protein DNHGIG_00460 [Collibacillus ludicampi]
MKKDWEVKLLLSIFLGPVHVIVSLLIFGYKNVFLFVSGVILSIIFFAVLWALAAKKRR